MEYTMVSECSSNAWWSAIALHLSPCVGKFHDLYIQFCRKELEGKRLEGKNIVSFLLNVQFVLKLLLVRIKFYILNCSSV